MKKHVWSLVLSVLMIVAGVAAIVVPPVAGIAATFVVGWLLILSGVMHLAYCWHRRGFGGIAWEILIGLLYLAVGIYILANPVGGLASLTLGLVFYLLAEAILELLLGFVLRSKSSLWLWFDVIVNLILAAMIWKTWPSSSAWAIGTLIGFGILFTGFTRLMLAAEARRAGDHEPSGQNPRP